MNTGCWRAWCTSSLPDVDTVTDLFVASAGITMVPAAAAHAPALVEFIRQNSEHLRAFLPAVLGVDSLDEATHYLHAMEDGAADGEIREWYLFSGAALCGSIRVKDIDAWDRKAKIGYFLGSQFQGRGIMTASLRVILHDCFTTLELNRIELHCAATNTASQAVAQRLGFTREGVLREDEWLNGAYVDIHVYGLLRAECMGGEVKKAQC